MTRSAVLKSSAIPCRVPDSRDWRRKARVISLQVLYEIDSVRREPEQALSRILRAWPSSPKAQAQARELIKGVVEYRDRIDKEIARFASSWPIGQLATVDRNILRIAIYEMIVKRKAPSKVAINEAIEMAKAFGSENSPRFVNGVLGSVLRIEDQEVHT